MSAETLLRELVDPACFPHAPADVELVQTHLSVVCLAGDRVYKLKKARRLPFVDFSTLAARRTACRDEVRLNRRLCPDVYLGTAALRRHAGRLLFAALGDDEGDGDLDVAVVMRRLPADLMLDRMVHERRATVAGIERLARHVAAFHGGADRGAAVLAAGDPDRLAGFAAANFAELRAVPDLDLPSDLLAALEGATATAFAALLPTLRQRAATGRVVDGHGDLHTRNVCMVEPPAVYDCIEFEPAFRCGDVATENAFLVMDLRYRAAPDLAAAYVRAYVAASGDVDQAAILPPLVAYRAMVRAKVAALAAAEPELPAADRDGARASARRHLLLAAAVAVEAQGPRWLLLCGPPASGKSSLAAELAAIAQWPHLATDVVRKRLAGVPPTSAARPEHYTPAFSQRTYDALLAEAAAATAAGAPLVLLDGNFPTADHRQAALAAARRAGARLDLAALAIDAATATARAAARAHDRANVSDAGPEVTAARFHQFVRPTAGEGLSVHDLDGRLPPPRLAERLLAQLLLPAAR
ncbi:MAG: AAA family ATPase [Planctomycetes bacterium]|nr:AAA family ATPase [Planctomycetota bacterium]